MSVSTIGNTYTYVYNTETKKLSTTDGKENDFVKYFNGEIKGSESCTLNNIDKQRKAGFQNVLSLLAQGGVFADSLDDDTVFEISSKNIDGDTIEYSINGKTYLTCNIAPALTYSEYKEIADIWHSGKAYSCTNNNGFTYPDSVYNKVLKRYEDWLYQPISDEKNSREVLQGKIAEMQENIENGDVDHDPVFQIGASEFTEKEWDRFLENYDELQEDIREAIKLEYEKALKESQEEAEIQKKLMEEAEEEEQLQKEQSIKEEDEAELLSSEYVSSIYANENSDGKEWHYITWFTPEGMFCKDVNGNTGISWAIYWEDEEQYQKVMNFIKQFPKDYHMQFASNQTFWREFLNDEINLDEYVKDLEMPNNI